MAPKKKQKRKQYLCKCHCGCRRGPGRLVICDWCGQSVGPGCCVFHEDALRARCHYCAGTAIIHDRRAGWQPERDDLQPRHNGLQPEHHSAQPEPEPPSHCDQNTTNPLRRLAAKAHGLQPEHDGLQPDSAMFHCNQGFHRSPTLCAVLAWRALREGRTASCPADMSPAGSARFAAVPEAHRDGREFIEEID